MALSSYFIADSVGNNIDGIAGSTSHACYPYVLANLMGWAIPTVDAQGGTGYTLTTGHTYADRAAACIAATPQVVFIEGGYNDKVIATSAADLQTAVASLAATLRAGLPNATIFILGIYDPTTPDSGFMGYNSAMRAAADAATGSTYFLDPLIDTLGSSWITSANAPVYISDGLHLTTLGHSYFAARIAMAIGNVSGSSLKQGLVDFWSLQEASGSRASVFGSMPLTDTNTVTQTSGPSYQVPLAAKFTATNSESLSRVDEAALSITADWSWAGWIRLDSKPANVMKVINKLVGTSDSPFEIRWLNTSDRFDVTVLVSSLGSIATANTFGAPTLATWCFLFASYTSADKKARISINNGAQDVSTAAAGNPIDTTNPLSFGANSAGSAFLDGAMAGWGLWSRVLTAAEITTLYNGGNGLLFPFYTGSFGGSGAGSIKGKSMPTTGPK